jgi:hypothetical protein
MTKIKLNLHDLLVNALGGETTHIPATIDVSELLDFNDIYESELDIDDLLHDNRLVAHVWSIDDVRSIRPDLNDDQAWVVLQRVWKDLDSARGITWEDIEQAAYDLFGSSGPKRIERCDKAIAAYNDDLPESNLIDFMADAMHWCKAKGHNFAERLEMARAHFDAETTGE